METALAPDPNPDANAALINAFCEITSASREEALFFLESHNFDLDAAVTTFLDNDHNFSGNPNVVINDNDNNAVNPILPSHSSPLPLDLHSPFPMPSQAPIEQRSGMALDRTAKNPSGSGTGGIRTLSDLKRPAPAASDSDSDEPQELFTGGEQSGMPVHNPTKGDTVDDIFNRARQVAVDGPPVYPLNSSTSKSFTGTARSLSGVTVSSAPKPPETITYTITFWRNGFSVDDGPLRRLDDPQNAPFLKSIRKSECPKELEPADRTTTVQVRLTRREENYPEPSKKSHFPFHGVGRTLGSSSSSSDATGEPNQTAVVGASQNTASLPSIGLVVNESQPVTSIQLRLADGTRMVSRFNHHHTIRDIRAFIDASKPGGFESYQLQTMGFPPKQLTDLSQTIEQAGIGNSVVIQKV